MSSILERMKQVKKGRDEVYSKINISNHPVSQESIELKMHYLNGLALMMNVDDDISGIEKDFFVSLIETFELSDSVIADFLKFAEEPENEQIIELLEELSKSDIVKFSFIIDNYIIANRDGKFEKEEEELIVQYFELLNFETDEIELISRFKEKSLESFKYEEEFKEFQIILSTPKDMVYVEGGTFIMGNNELLKHEVTLDSFFIGIYPVTQKEWENLIGIHKSEFKGAKLPVDTVAWKDAVHYCNIKSQREGLEQCYRGKGDETKCDLSKNGYRLLTEAEWEYAARGGNKSKEYTYSGSNNLDEVAWHSKNSKGKTHPVGEKRANELGIYDMTGNVDELCNDLFGDYTSDSLTNPLGDENGNCHVLRGGSWESVVSRAFSEQIYDVGSRGTGIIGLFSGDEFTIGGFRIARSLK